MAFGSRNSLLTLFLSLAIMFCVIFFLSLFGTVISSRDSSGITFFQSHPFWFAYAQDASGSPSNQIGIVLVLIGGAVAFYFTRLVFKRTGQPEIFFVTLFFFSLLPETLRMTIMFLELLQAPPFSQAVLSQLVYSGRILGILCLFFASLYALDFQYQKFELILGLIVIVSFVLTFSVPFDTELLLTNGLLKLSDELGVFIVYFSLIVVILFDYLIAAFRGRHLLIPAAIVLLLVGRETLFFALSPLALIAGGLSLAAGALLLSRDIKLHFTII